MRKLLLILCLLSQFVGFSQTYLNVPLISQKQSNWCWAASIEMIEKYHNINSTTSQCQILNFYQKIRGKDTCNFDICKCNSIQNCDYELQIVDGMLNGSQYLERILDTLSFHHSSLTNITLDWDSIKAQIDQCLPIILIIHREALSGIGNAGQHAIVIDGYLDRDCERYLLIKDPWETCETGCSYALNYDDLTNPGRDDAAITSLYWMHNIKPKNSRNICDVPKPIERPVIKDMYQCPQSMPRLSTGQYKSSPTTVMNASLADLFGCFPNTVFGATKLGFQNQMKYLKKYTLHTISTQKIIDPKLYNKPFTTTKRLLYHSPQYDNFQVVLRKVNYRKKIDILECPLRRVEDYWLVESLGTCSYICPSTVAECGTVQPVWIDYKFILIPFFEIVCYPPLNYNFRRFKYKNQYYYYSLQDYESLVMNNKTHLKAQRAYPEYLVLQQLHKKIIQSKF